MMEQPTEPAWDEVPPAPTQVEHLDKVQGNFTEGTWTIDGGLKVAETEYKEGDMNPHFLGHTPMNHADVLSIRPPGYDIEWDPMANNPFPEIRQLLTMPDPWSKSMNAVWNSCAGKFVVSGVGGYVMGGAFGAFMGMLGGGNVLPPGTPFKAHLRQMGQEITSGMRFHSRNFALIGSLYSSTECIMEKYRGKHDMTNTVVAGCITGGGLAGKGGPVAAAGGCAMFAGFCVAIDYFFMGH